MGVALPVGYAGSLALHHHPGCQACKLRNDPPPPAPDSCRRMGVMVSWLGEVTGFVAGVEMLVGVTEAGGGGNGAHTGEADPRPGAAGLDGGNSRVRRETCLASLIPLPQAAAGKAEIRR